MPLFLAEHSWEKEKTPVVTKGGLDLFMRPEVLPKNVKLCAAYMLPGEQAICIWEADKAETLENVFKAMIDVFPAARALRPCPSHHRNKI